MGDRYDWDKNRDRDRERLGRWDWDRNRDYFNERYGDRGRPSTERDDYGSRGDWGQQGHGGGFGNRGLGSAFSGYGAGSYAGGMGPYSGGMGGYSERGRFSGRGPKGWVRSDDRIRDDINERLTDHPGIDAYEVEVQVKNGEVTLTGTVDDRVAKRLAEDIAQNVSGVKDVHNQVRIEPAERTNRR
jgi:hypothetical protein